MKAFSGDLNPRCSQVRMQGHTIKKTSANRADSNNRDSGNVYIPNDELDAIMSADPTDVMCGYTKPDCTDGYQNLFQTINDYVADNNMMKNNVYLDQDQDKDKDKDKDEDLMTKIYYISLMFFFAMLIFKMNFRSRF